MKGLYFCAVFLGWIAFANETDSQIQALETSGKDFVAAINNGDVSHFDKLFDAALFSQIIEKTTYEILGKSKGEDPDLDQFFKEQIQQLREEFNKGTFGKRLLGQPIDRGAVLYFLRARMKHGHPQWVLRLDENLGYTHWEVHLHKTAEGFKIKDSFFYNAGMAQSESVAHVLVSLYLSNAGLVNKVLGKGENFLKEFNKIIQAQQKYWTEPDTSVALLESLKSEVKDTRFAMVITLAVYSNHDEKRFLEAVTYYSKRYPNHPSLKVHGIHAGLLTGDYDEALKAVEELNHAVGGDLFLQTETARILIDMQDFEGAEKAFERAAKAPGSDEMIANGRLGLALVQEKYGKVVEYLNLLESDFGYYFEKGFFDEDDQFQGFLASEAYAAWTKKRSGGAVDQD